MLHTIIQKNSYQDSINLMLLTNEIATTEGINKVQIMMATPANKDIFKTAGLHTEELEAAESNDMAIVIDTDDENKVSEVLEKVEQYLQDQSISGDSETFETVRTLDRARKVLPNANVALISVPGQYAAEEAHKVLDLGMHAFLFSDNVSIEDEVALKEKAKEKGLLVMGPDCGTGILDGIPMAFANVVNKGRIGVVGASGTGIQEVTAIIDRKGEGVSHAIGTGGRDLSEAVGALTMMESIKALENHNQTDIIVVISKPPAKEVREKVESLLHSLSKPVVTIFLGEKPTQHEGNVYQAYTLEETALIAVDLAQKNDIKENYANGDYSVENAELADGQKTIKGLFSGGTLASEAAVLISDALGLGSHITNVDGYVLKESGHEVVDLGDDKYTQGKPHPMIDPETRAKFIEAAAEDETTAVIVLDFVLGYGSHDDMATALLPSIETAVNKAKEAGRTLHVIASVCGTTNDPQSYSEQGKKLADAGLIVKDNNNEAVRTALNIVGLKLEDPNKVVVPFEGKIENFDLTVSEQITDLLNNKPSIINIGLKSFTDAVLAHGGRVVHYDWRPVAGGNEEMRKVLSALNKINDETAEANNKVVEKITNSAPFLVDVVLAKEKIVELNEGKVLLHAGPPIKWEDMTGPMQGSCIGAGLFEGWAETEAEVRAMLENGEVKFIPCHHVNAVGPMGGITSANMPVFVVENRLDKNEAYCIMNEGIGKVLRFGAYSEEVVNRLNWMRDVLGPTISKALKLTDDGLNLNVMVARAITMGDEFHQRNIAASLIFLKEISPYITQLDMDANDRTEVIRFLADTDQFFLNIAMAMSKAVMDGARTITEGTVVTAMCRNGKDFGIRISGMGDEWFTAPVNTPEGLFFTGYSQDDANPDIGDSAITETFGVGGMAMIAAPGVTRFVGAGGFGDALKTSDEMSEICIGQNSNFTIPTWDFQGACLGIDARKVVETGIEPVINTGIAHKEAGVGQVGAGTVRAPKECFEKALDAYAKKLGLI